MVNYGKNNFRIADKKGKYFKEKFRTNFFNICLFGYKSK